MSQRRFAAGTFRVLTGWDRPLQHHFCVITDPEAEAPAEAGDEEADASSLVYSNLQDPDLFPTQGGMTVEQVAAVLARHHITPPATLLDDLRLDAIENAGNVVVDYGSVTG